MASPKEAANPLIKELILASASPFRRALLESAGVKFRVETAPVDEYTIVDVDPRRLATRRAEAKALAMAAEAPEALVIGADQVLSLEGGMFGKAKTEAEAKMRLASLAGKVHFLHSAVVLAYLAPGGKAAVLDRILVDCKMPLRPLTSAEIDAYVATGEWQGSVGCYQYENRGIHLVDGASAEHSAIVGLPLQALLKSLRRLGVEPLLKATPPWTLRS